MMVGCTDETAGLEGNGGWGEYSSRVQAVCSYWGPSDFSSMPGNKINQGSDSAEARFLGGTIDEIPDTYVLASPVTHVNPHDPPLLLVHGTLDPVVPFNQSTTIFQAYQQAGLEAELIEVTGAGHGLRKMTDNPIHPPQAEIDQITLDFFSKHLLGDR
jgi:dipeptidyl aminopeptidase/acylaminoacyl peptidase